MVYFLDSYYFIFVVPALLFALYAQNRVRSTYQRYSRYYARTGITAGEMTRQILMRADIHDVEVASTPGQLTDHYDPRNKVVRLSQGVYNSSSIAALGIAAHEVGHVMQHKHGYAPLAIRNSLVPVAQLGTTLAFPLFFLGLVAFEPLVNIALLVFLGAVIFQIITLPVEFNASARAVALLEQGGYLTTDETKSARQVLNAAALTYVAATAMAIAQFLRFFALANRRRR